MPVQSSSTTTAHKVSFTAEEVATALKAAITTLPDNLNIHMGGMPRIGRTARPSYAEVSLPFTKEQVHGLLVTLIPTLPSAFGLRVFDDNSVEVTWLEDAPAA